MEIGNRIRELRQKVGLSGRALAIKVGLDPSQINKIEHNINKPSLEALEKICTALGITLSEFFSDTQEQEPLPPDIRRLLGLAHRLTPRQREILLAAAEEWAELNPD
ncbi:MAG: helix-turn-helix transcriptional regulator [Bacillota bacterium]